MKDLKMYINGKFVESRSGKWIDVLNPSTEEVISRQPEGTIEDVNEALDAAKAAQPAWAALPAIQRAACGDVPRDGAGERRALGPSRHAQPPGRLPRRARLRPDAHERADAACCRQEPV